MYERTYVTSYQRIHIHLYVYRYVCINLPKQVHIYVSMYIDI